jgi:hypothetical protein
LGDPEAKSCKDKRQNGSNPLREDIHMYRRECPGQISFQDFYLPFGGKLSGKNRWVKLAALIPWQDFEQEYAEQFDERLGAPAKSFRMALGALIIKEKLGVSDEEAVEQIRENPYLQYFLGQHEFSDEPPFDPSLYVQFRKRVGLELLNRLNEQIVAQAIPPQEEVSGTESLEAESDEAAIPVTHAGAMLVDATCAPADIAYPTDLRLLNQGREVSEAVIDGLYAQIQQALQEKPRTYRRKARKQYLALAKQRRPKASQLGRAIGQQLGHLQRNQGHIDALLAAGASLSQLEVGLYRKLLVTTEMQRQQQLMYHCRSHRIEHRIVSLAQPHVRPMIRGKAAAPVEFGAKLSVSQRDGFCLLERISWDNFNESGDLPAQVEAYKRRFGVYPVSVHADQIYRTRANRAYCAARGIRLSGPPLGRPPADPLRRGAASRQVYEDQLLRNGIEGKFGQGKRRFGLGRIMSKLAETALTSIAVCFLVMNLQKLLELLSALLLWLRAVWIAFQQILWALWSAKNEADCLVAQD